MTYRRIDAAEVARIEMEARRLRAEAMRDMFSGLSRRVRGLFAHSGAAKTRHA